jgi:hypothetical protein
MALLINKIAEKPCGDEEARGERSTSVSLPCWKREGDGAMKKEDRSFGVRQRGMALHFATASIILGLLYRASGISYLEWTK